jgi:predicted xylose isomerase-like sugar epimerase
MINKKVPSINIISNGNVWNQNQVDNIKKASLYGIRVNSINALRLFNKKNNEE